MAQFGIALGQPFGRFGYVDRLDVPGFDVDRSGFRIQQDRADRFRFEEPSKLWKALATSDMSHTVGLSGVGRSPSKLRFDLTAPGFSLYVQNGLTLRLASNSAPYLSWNEASVGSGVPTPATKWILVSFRDSQPPLLIAVLGEPTPFQVSGRSGDWRIKSVPLYRGWIRVSAPLGLRPFATNSVVSLGEVKSKVQSVAKYLTGPPPKLVKTEVTEEPTSVTATWTFDAPFALAPTPAILAPLAGYPLSLESGTTRLDSSDPAGPISVLLENTLRIRFPVRRIPTGRGLALGAPDSPAIGTVSPIDIPSVAELALANLTANRDQLTRESAEETLSKYIGDTVYSLEPHTNQRLPYVADGGGMDLAAAHALLMQSTITTVKATSEPNSLLTSVLWRRDWRTWRLWAPDTGIARRAASLAAVAAALCPEPVRRLDAAMLEAGLVAEDGLRIWQERNGHARNPKSEPAPWDQLRRALFLMPGRSEAAEAYVRSLLSEIRVYGERGIRAEPKNGGVAIRWAAENERPLSLIFASAYPLEASPLTNLLSATAEDALGFTVLRCTPKGAGICEALIKPPSWAAPLPGFAEPPRYSSLANLAMRLGTRQTSILKGI